MPGSRDEKKKKKRLTELKEKKMTLSTEVKADHRALGQQGLASSAATHASYGQSMTTQHRTKGEINAEFWA